jgi:uncharacterized protein YndB with AHSA1/START domain
MADVLHQVGINASPEALYNVLTEESGLQNWWSQHSKVDGATVEVSFYNGMVTFVFIVAESIPDEKLVWEVKGGPPDWLGTTVTWTIFQNEGQTMLHLAHRGFASTDGNFANVNYNWGWYVTSIKFLLEKGEGMPHTDADLM